MTTTLEDLRESLRAIARELEVGASSSSVNSESSNEDASQISPTRVPLPSSPILSPQPLRPMLRPPSPEVWSGESDERLVLPSFDTAHLCSTCSSMFQPGWAMAMTEWAPHHKRQIDLEQAVGSGCRICALLLDWLDDEGVRVGSSGLCYKNQPDSNQIVLVSPLQHRRNYFLLQICPVDETKPYPTDGSLYIRGDLDRDMELLLEATAIANSTKSASSLRLAHHWLQTCREKHYKCGDIISAARSFPSRLLHISVKDGRVLVKLCEGTSVEPQSLYLTLSHCWGKTKTFSLLRENLDDLKTNIPVSSLPRIFQDAIFMTWNFGFAYLWIDSLCIMQDCDDDWAAEAARMGQVYKNAACNLAATGFPDGEHSLFVERKAENLIPFKISTEQSGSRAYPGTAYYLYDANLWRHGVSEAPLNLRGWVTQERLLSPCVLHFGGKQLFWECFEMRCCETFPDGLPRKLDAGRRLKQIYFLEERPTTPPRGSPMETYDRYLSTRTPNSKHLFHFWRRIVQLYSLGELTIPEDKLPAIQGVVTEMKKLLEDDFLAGMWRRTLLYDLLWSLSSLSPDHKPPGDQPRYRAPTWSWASLEGPISFRQSWSLDPSDPSSTLQHSTILHVETLPLPGYSHTGRVIGGHLRIRGPLKEVWLSASGDDGLDCDWDVCIGQSFLQAFITLDFNSTGRLRQLEKAYKTLPTGRKVLVYVGGGFLFYAYRRRAFLLPLMSEDSWTSVTAKVYGLVLYPSGRARGEFVRIGVFMTRGDWTMELLLDPSHKIADEFYENKDGDGNYTVTIV